MKTSYTKDITREELQTIISVSETMEKLEPSYTWWEYSIMQLLWEIVYIPQNIKHSYYIAPKFFSLRIEHMFTQKLYMNYIYSSSIQNSPKVETHT